MHTHTHTHTNKPTHPPTHTSPQVRAALTLPPGSPAVVQVVTGFLGKAHHSGAITTLGRGGSDLTATLIGAALDLREVQVCLRHTCGLCVCVGGARVF
jgi:aspartokinase